MLPRSENLRSWPRAAHRLDPGGLLRAKLCNVAVCGLCHRAHCSGRVARHGRCISASTNRHVGLESSVIDERDVGAPEANAPLEVLPRAAPLWAEHDRRPGSRTFAQRSTLAAQSPSIIAAGMPSPLGPDVGCCSSRTRPDHRFPAPAAVERRPRLGRMRRVGVPRFPKFRRKHRGLPRHAGFSTPSCCGSKHDPTPSRDSHVLLDQDYVACVSPARQASDRADSSRTADGYARWQLHDRIVAACGLDRTKLPRLVDSAEIAGILRDELAVRWQLPKARPFVGGGGDIKNVRRGLCRKPGCTLRPISVSAPQRLTPRHPQRHVRARSQRRHAHPSSCRLGPCFLSARTTSC